MTEVMYNTGNAVPSPDPKDRHDNSLVLDAILNGTATQVVNRVGQLVYTMAYFNTLMVNGQGRIDVIVAGVNAQAEASKAAMIEAAETIGADLNNKYYQGPNAYAEMLADTQNRDAVVAVVDGNSDAARDGWYIWNMASSVWVRAENQPVTSSEIASLIQQDFISEDELILGAKDDSGFLGFMVNRNKLKTASLEVGQTGSDTDRYTADMTGGNFQIIDESGFVSVSIGADEMTAIADAKDAAKRLGRPATSYAPISRSANKVIAHRGAHYADSAPENSLDSYRIAGIAGFKYVETDLVRTSDGAFVICHDDTINRTFTNLDGSAISGAVSVLGTSLATLRANYVFKTPIIRYRRPIPTLEEFLATCVEFNLYPMIELKYAGFTEAELAAINDLCVRYLGNELMYIAGGQARLALMRNINPRVMIGFVLNTFDETAYNFLVNNKPSCLDMNYANITADHVLRARKDGITVAAYTLPATAYSDISKIGCDLIAGDELAPELVNQQILYSNVAAGVYDGYKTSGAISDGQVTLTAARYLTLLWNHVVQFGGAYLVVEFTGAIIITAGTSSKSFTSSTGRRTYRTQIQLFGQTPNVSFRGGTGGCVIHEVSVAIASF